VFKVERLEEEIRDARLALATSKSASSAPMPASAAVIQLGKAEEQMVRLQRQLLSLEEQKKMYYETVQQLELRLEKSMAEVISKLISDATTIFHICFSLYILLMHSSLSLKTHNAQASQLAFEESNAGLTKELKGLKTEIQILKDDLGRTRDR